MRFSKSWLDRHLETTWDAEKLSDTMTAFGAEVESVEAYAGGGREDVIFEINVTPNRGDWASVRGVARDLAVCGAGRLLPLPMLESVVGNFASPIKLAPLEGITRAESGCAMFYGRYFRGLTNCPSPDWMQLLLRSVGIEPHSMLVDVTNFVTLDLCRPAHMYDAKQLRGPIDFRAGVQGETFETLAGTVLTLPHGVGVIADAIGPIAIAGVIGGKRAACADTTTDAFLEVAYFDPISVARAGRLLSIVTDARYRFERGVDPQLLAYATEYITQLVLEACGGETSTIVNVGAISETTKTISYNYDCVEQKVGIPLTPEVQKTILAGLGFKLTENSHALEITPPSWRHDVKGDADIVEEVMRIYGYDHLVEQPLPAIGCESAQKRFLPMIQSSLQLRNVQRAATHALCSRGFDECVTWSFALKASNSQLHDRQDGLQIANPISVDLDQLRSSITPNLVSCACSNVARGAKYGALFEVGPIFARVGDRIVEQSVLSALRFGFSSRKTWRVRDRHVDFFDMVEDLEYFCAALNLGRLKITEEPAPTRLMHPSRTAMIHLASQKIGVISELHPTLGGELGLNLPVVWFELELEKVVQTLGARSKATHSFVRSELLNVERDLSLVVPAEVVTDSVLEAIRELLGSALNSVRVFDLYVGENIPLGKKSLGISLMLNQVNKSLTSEQLEQICVSLVAHLKQLFSAELR